MIYNILLLSIIGCYFIYLYLNNIKIELTNTTIKMVILLLIIYLIF